MPAARAAARLTARRVRAMPRRRQMCHSIGAVFEHLIMDTQKREKTSFWPTLAAAVGAERSNEFARLYEAVRDAHNAGRRGGPPAGSDA